MAKSEHLLSILNIEDSEADFAHHQKILGKGGLGKVYVERVQTMEELVVAFRERKWDIVLSDYHLAKLTVYDAIRCAKSHDEKISFIVLSGAIGEEAAVQVMKAGVDDFVLKSSLDQLVRSIRRCQRELDSRQREEVARRMAEEAIGMREQMLAIVTHDIKNPLSAIELNAQILNRIVKQPNPRFDLRAETLAQTERILKATLRMRRLIGDILDQSAIEAGVFKVNRTPERILPIVLDLLEIYRPLADEKSIFLNADLLAADTEFPVDREKFAQIISNLLGNAIKFTPPRGKVDLCVRFADPELMISVEDSGPGLPDGTQENIFKRFWRSDVNPSAGTGLGLFIAQGIAKAHNGKIGVRNVPGGGAHFWVTLGRDESVAAGGARAGAAKAPRVLLIEDDSDLREAMEAALVADGAEVIAFANGELAIEYLRRPGVAVPDVIVVDYRMPIMNGEQFVAHLHDSPRDDVRTVPVVLMSADEEIAELSRRMKVNAFVKKPPDLRNFVQTVFAQICSR